MEYIRESSAKNVTTILQLFLSHPHISESKYILNKFGLSVIDIFFTNQDTNAYDLDVLEYIKMILQLLLADRKLIFKKH